MAVNALILSPLRVRELPPCRKSKSVTALPCVFSARAISSVSLTGTTVSSRAPMSNTGALMDPAACDVVPHPVTRAVATGHTFVATADIP